CTTRVRDLIDRATDHALGRGSTSPSPLTFRQIGHRGIAGLPPLISLSDFVLGRQLDDTPTIWQAMFHPDVLRHQVEVALGVAPVRVYQRRRAAFPTDGSTFRLQTLLLAAVFAIPLLVAQWRRRGEKLAQIWATVW